jgi:hypothetical protein
MMGDKVGVGLAFMATMVAYSGTYLLTTMLVAHTLRLGIAKYVLGMGPIIFTSGSFTLRFWPMMSYFLPAQRKGITPLPPGLAAAIHRGERRYYDDLPFAIAISIAVALPLLVAVLGSALFLGFVQASTETIDALRGYVAGALGPLTRAPELLDGALAQYQHSRGGSFSGHVLAVAGGIAVLGSPSSAMFLLGLQDERFVWPRVRTLFWLVARASEVAWLIGYVVWSVRG